MLTSGPRVSGVVVRGVDPDRVNQVVDIERYIRDGSLQSLKQPQPLQIQGRTVLLPGVIIGTRLANQLGVFVGSPIQVVSPLGSPTAIGVIPKVRRFVVVGIFDSGMSEIDSTLVYMSLADAQKFFELETRLPILKFGCRMSTTPKAWRKIYNGDWDFLT